MGEDAGLLWAVVGGIGGIAGALIGIVALVYAHKANGKAETSNGIAGDSKTLAEQANELARESNTIAAAAKGLAEEANAYSHRAESRETEQHDVRWDDGWLMPERGIYAVTKRGDDAAHNVRVTVEYEGEEQTLTADLMEKEGGQMRFGGIPRSCSRLRSRASDVSCSSSCY